MKMARGVNKRFNFAKRNRRRAYEHFRRIEKYYSRNLISLLAGGCTRGRLLGKFRQVRGRWKFWCCVWKKLPLRYGNLIELMKMDEYLIATGLRSARTGVPHSLWPSPIVFEALNDFCTWLTYWNFIKNAEMKITTFYSWICDDNKLLEKDFSNSTSICNRDVTTANLFIVISWFL